MSGAGRIARFERRFVVRAPSAAVRAFHADPRAVRRLTPAPLQFLAPPPPVEEGARIRFRLWLPFPVAWTARYEGVREDGFLDVQEEGPFRRWRHEHSWRELAPGVTEVRDVVEAEPGGAASRLLWLGLRPAFAYRAWVTRRALRRSVLRS